MNKTKKQTDPKAEERKTNKQINYFIIRTMWQVIRGRSKKHTVYDEFEIGRERFTRAIDCGIIRYSDRDWDNNKDKGIPKELFTGERRIEFYYKGKDGRNQRFPKEKWETWAKWRYQQKAITVSDNERIDEDGSKIQKELYACLKVADTKNTNTLDFYKLCYYIETEKAALELPANELLKKYRQEIQKIEFEVLDKCDTEALRGLQKDIKQIGNLIGAVITYREAQAGRKENK